MSELERPMYEILIDNLVGDYRTLDEPDMRDLLADIARVARAEGVEEGLEKAAKDAIPLKMLMSRWIVSHDRKPGESDKDHQSRKAVAMGNMEAGIEKHCAIRALQSKPVIIDRAGNTWQQVKPCPDCNKEGGGGS